MKPWSTMDGIQRGKDPKVTYETVLRAFPKVPEDVVGTLIAFRDKKWCGKCQKKVSVKQRM
jgi:hypothetical protein